jgi:hypothetical protein
MKSRVAAKMADSNPPTAAIVRIRVFVDVSAPFIGREHQRAARPREARFAHYEIGISGLQIRLSHPCVLQRDAVNQRILDSVHRIILGLQQKGRRRLACDRNTRIQLKLLGTAPPKCSDGWPLTRGLPPRSGRGRLPSNRCNKMIEELSPRPSQTRLPARTQSGMSSVGLDKCVRSLLKKRGSASRSPTVAAPRADDCLFRRHERKRVGRYIET